MDIGDVILGFGAFLLWAFIAIPAGVVVGMAIHLANSDADLTPRHFHCWKS